VGGVTNADGLWGQIGVGLAVLDLLLVGVGVWYVLSHPREPRAMLAWILAFLLLPLVGVVLFFVISDPRLNRSRRRLARRRRELDPALWSKLRAHHAAFAAGKRWVDAPPRQRAFLELATRVNNAQPPTAGNALTIYHDRAREAAQALEDAIAGARHHVHLEYFIFKPDRSGRRIADLLGAQARAGVKCRLLVDHVGNLGWPASFEAALVAAGVEVAYFNPILPWRAGRRWSSRLNFRNHRKIAVIDGRVAFTGSQNVGDEYFGVAGPHGLWVDTHLRVAGPAVYELQETFLEDWHVATGGDLFEAAQFPDHPPDDAGASHVVQVIPSGPDYDAQIMHHLLLAAISAADRSVCIGSPYFVPDTAMVLTLEAAAFRGVRVRLLVPGTSDHRLALWAGRSYYRDLTAAGVEIRELVPRFLHSKLVLVDETWGMIGSANMDERSFRLNFEITAVLYDAGPVGELQREFDAMWARAGVVDGGGPRGQLEQLKLGLARLVSPLY
jgi:cardiolipin synthase